MKRYTYPFLLLSLLGLVACKQSEPSPAYAIAIHGGAGTILKEDMSPELENAYRLSLDSALTIGEAVLKNGGSALDAVEQTILFLEDSPLFNAGKGAVLTYEGFAELDASIMDGATQNAGAVGGVRTLRNPIRGARAVMEQSPHVFLSGPGADQFGAEKGLDTVANSYFYTPRRMEEWKETHPDTTPAYLGTVGCVALDQKGNLAAGTSTGGMSDKRYNRIGDSPVIGAGTYADNATCAVSCTGHGEFFIRYAVAHDLSSRIAYLQEDVQTAADHIIKKSLLEKGGSGGLIALDRKGRVAMPFNTPGMYRGYAKPGERYVGIYMEE
ncbi:MAG: isoaspartyl peptidase/L-asparaginase [Saprospirales bacterium]|nr:isoaspartyl peptidase/L-asparaginase [Saprospirales bacterium]MBK6904192.1 isoaspartyl peptidase/L-asparaginase [Saprospirales bacterium]MBK7338876.1 isoaspartyl peptidase/L-asparaginase [Saprospirales bacterium]